MSNRTLQLAAFIGIHLKTHFIPGVSFPAKTTNCSGENINKIHLIFTIFQLFPVDNLGFTKRYFSPEHHSPIEPTWNSNDIKTGEASHSLPIPTHQGDPDVVLWAAARLVEQSFGSVLL